MATDYENSTKKVGCVAQQECHEEVCKKAPPSMVTGRCDYYQNRYDNYIERHRFDSKSGGDNPPNYYLNYGFKYCSKFSKETMPKLSPQGKIWLNNTLKKLQKLMEQGIVQKNYKSDINISFNEEYLIDGVNEFYTGIECRDEDFTQFAFATHPDAYTPKDFKNLTCNDLMEIGLTAKDEFTGKYYKETIYQAWLVAKELYKIGDLSEVMEHCNDESTNYLDRKIDELTDEITDIFSNLADTVSRGGI